MLLSHPLTTSRNVFSIGKGVISLLRNPSNTQSVYDIEDGLYGSQAMNLAVDFIKADASTAELVQDRYIALPPI